MIEMTVGEVRAPEFTQAYLKLMNTKGYGGTAAYRINKLAKALEREQKEGQVAFDKLIKEWAIFDDPKDPSRWRVAPEKLEGWKKVVAEFHDNKIKIDLWKLPLEWLEKADLTPMEYAVLEPISTEDPLPDLKVVSKTGPQVAPPPAN